MDNGWRELDEAPLCEVVLLCKADCEVVSAVQEERPGPGEGGKKTKTELVWYYYPKRPNYTIFERVNNPKCWQKLPEVPRYLLERKLTADLLEKQIQELRK